MSSAFDNDIILQRQGDKALHVTATKWNKEYSYTYYLFCDKELIGVIKGSGSGKFKCSIKAEGEYQVIALVEDGKSKRYCQSDLLLCGEEKPKTRRVKPRRNIFKCTKDTFLGIIRNFPRIFQLARFDIRLKNTEPLLGKVWDFLTPFMRIAVYWLLFGLGIRNRADVDGFPFIVWMVCGMSAWSYMSKLTTGGARSIASKSQLITKLNFPTAAIPVSSAFTHIYELLIMLAICLFLMIFHGGYPTIYAFNLVYYIIYMFVFVCCLGMITSAITIKARDFALLLQSVMRLIFFTSGVIWPIQNFPDIMLYVIKLSPYYYVVTGFRDSLMYNISFYEHTNQIMFFWGLNLVLFVIGAYMQTGLRNKIVDLI